MNPTYIINMHKNVLIHSWKYYPKIALLTPTGGVFAKNHSTQLFKEIIQDLKE